MTNMRQEAVGTAGRWETRVDGRLWEAGGGWRRLEEAGGGWRRLEACECCCCYSDSIGT